MFKPCYCCGCWVAEALLELHFLAWEPHLRELPNELVYPTQALRLPVVAHHGRRTVLLSAFRILSIE